MRKISREIAATEKETVSHKKQCLNFVRNKIKKNYVCESVRFWFDVEKLEWKKNHIIPSNTLIVQTERHTNINSCMLLDEKKHCPSVVMWFWWFGLAVHSFYCTCNFQSYFVFCLKFTYLQIVNSLWSKRL